MSERLLHRESYRLQAFECDRAGQLPIAVLCRDLQMTADAHATALGVSVHQLQDSNLTWVLLHLRVHLLRELGPGAGNITVETWPSGCDRRFADRDFTVFAGDAVAPLAAACSRWLVLDRSSGRSLSLPESIRSRIPRKALRARPEPVLRLPSLADAELTRDFPVRLTDLDVNEHVNNVRYVELLSESVPLSIWRGQRMIALAVSFRAGALYGQTIRSTARHLAEDGTVYLHRLGEAKDGTEFVRARSEWR